MNERGVVATQAQAHLAGGFEKRKRLDIADRAADLDDGDLGGAVPGLVRAAGDEILDFIGNVRDHLHGLAQIIAAALFAQHGFVDLAGREVIDLAHLRRDEALVVAKVEVGFGAVFGHENLAVLKRAHGARIDVDIGIEFEKCDLQAT